MLLLEPVKLAGGGTMYMPSGCVGASVCFYSIVTGRWIGFTLVLFSRSCSALHRQLQQPAMDGGKCEGMDPNELCRCPSKIPAAGRPTHSEETRQVLSLCTFLSKASVSVTKDTEYGRDDCWPAALRHIGDMHARHGQLEGLHICRALHHTAFLTPLCFAAAV